VKGRCNPNYRPDLKFHPTFGWNYFLSNKRDVNMMSTWRYLSGPFFVKKKMDI
jgi:hypothetical protein